VRGERVSLFGAVEAVEPAALEGGVEHTARNQCVDPSGEFVRAGE